MRGRSGGSIYRRPESAHLWLKWYDQNGIPHRASSGTDNVADAKKALALKIAAAVKDEPVITRRVRVNDLLDAVRDDYTNNDQALRPIMESLKRLRAFLGRQYANAVTTDAVSAYVAKHRRTDGNPNGLANGTVNRDLSVLRRGYSLALQSTPPKVTIRPHFPMLKEAAPRAGFFEPAQYEAVRRELPADLQVAIALQHTLGWRGQSEVLTLERRHLDLEAGCIRLDPGSTKNDDARVVYLPPALVTVLAEQVDRVKDLERSTGRIISCLFPHLTNGRRHVRGDRRKDFVKAWRTAAQRAGVPAMRRHDFRRTAIRDMVNDGTPEKVAMMISGHKTRSVFDRYHIVAPEDLKAAAARMAARESSPAQRGNVTQLRAQSGRLEDRGAR